MSNKYKDDGFMSQISNMFKRTGNQDLFRLGGKGGINILNSPQTKEEMKTKQEFQVLRQFLQQKNWNMRHVELYDEYRRMDSTYPIIAAALSLYSQEVCITGDTVISTMQGDFTIKELYDKKNNFFNVRSFNPKYKKVRTFSLCNGIKHNGIKPVFEVTLTKEIDSETAEWDNKNSVLRFKCTDNHKIYVGYDQAQDKGLYKELKHLKVGDEIPAFYDFIDPSCNCKEQKYSKAKILRINYVGEEEVYDLINVEPYNHFAIKLSESVRIVVHNCNKDADGNIFKVVSDDKSIVQSLEEAYYDNLKLDSRSYLLVRSMMKFGNTFSYLQARRGEGVVDLIQLPPESIRINLLDSDSNRLDQFKYNWYGYGGNMEFEPWEVVHWKIIQDIETEPYGQSILRSVVETWRRIILMREALIIYRITRAPQRFLYKIDTTGLDADSALRHAQNIKQQLSRKPMTDPKTGEMDYRHYSMPIHKDSPIPLLDGRTITIEELAKEYELGLTNYVYSIKDETHEVVAGKVIWCGKNYTTRNLVKIILDNDTYVLSAPEHPFIKRDGTRISADKLIVGDSLMPCYLDQKKVSSKSNSTYTTIYNPATEKYEFVHRLVAKEVEGKTKEINTVHHKDFNRYNNRPDNLQWMNSLEHILYHSSLNRERNLSKNGQVGFAISNYNNSELHKEHNKIRKISSSNVWKDNDKKEQIIRNMIIMFNDKIISTIKTLISLKEIKSQSQAVNYINENFIEELKKENPFLNYSKISKNVFKANINRLGYKNFDELQFEILGYNENSRGKSVSITKQRKRLEKESLFLNHKVKAIEYLEVDGEDVYCMSVVGLNGEHDRHNFAVLGLDINSNKVIETSGIQVVNTVLDDIYMPTFAEDLSDVRVLEGASNLDAVEDYKIIKDDLFAGLLIPKAFLTFEEQLCVRGNTVVLTTEGKQEIQNLANNFERNPKLKIYTLSCDEKGYITQGKILWCKKTKEVDKLYRIHLSNGNYEDVTENHPFLNEKLKYIRADELIEGERLKNIYNKDIFVSKIEIISLTQKEWVYDLEVDKYHNFAVGSSIFVHNSNKAVLSQEDARFSNAVRQYQSYYIEGLLQVGLVHLYMNGFSQEEIQSFEIQMNNPSTVTEENKIELMQKRFDLAKSALDTSNGQLTIMSYVDVLKQILHFSDDEVSKTIKNQFIEKKLTWRLKQIEEQGFYEEPDPEKRKAKLRNIVDSDDVFKELQFESVQLENIYDTLKTKIDQEVAELNKPTKGKPSKKQVNKVIALNESRVRRNYKKVIDDLGIKEDMIN